jgi:hypothetical protein
MASSSTASKSNNTALEACDMPCIPEFKKNTNDSVTKRCDESLLTGAQCHLFTSTQERFYNAIKWKVLTDTINTSMSYFIEELNTNAALASLIQKAYKFGPVRNESGETVRRFGRLGFRVLNNENFRFCNNLIIKITLEVRARTQELSHISLHPKLPFYYRDTRRSRSGCGYYIKDAAAGAPRGRSRSRSAGRGRSSAAAAGRSRSRSRSRSKSKSKSRSRSANQEAEIGPFHYKVDTLYWKDKPFRSEKHIPFTEFHPDPANPGHFFEETGDFREDIARHEIILEKKKPKEVPVALAAKLKTQAAEQAKTEAKSGEVSKQRKKEILKELVSAALETLPEAEAGSDDEGTLSRDMIEQIDTLNRVHKGISHMFLEFWNHKLLTGVEAKATRVNQVNQYPGFPAILKSAEGGSRRTRKVRR